MGSGTNDGFGGSTAAATSSSLSSSSSSSSSSSVQSKNWMLQKVDLTLSLHRVDITTSERTLIQAIIVSLGIGKNEGLKDEGINNATPLCTRPSPPLLLDYTSFAKLARKHMPPPTAIVAVGSNRGTENEDEEDWPSNAVGNTNAHTHTNGNGNAHSDGDVGKEKDKVRLATSMCNRLLNEARQEETFSPQINRPNKQVLSSRKQYRGVEEILLAKGEEAVRHKELLKQQVDVERFGPDSLTFKPHFFTSASSSSAAAGYGGATVISPIRSKEKSSRTGIISRVSPGNNDFNLLSVNCSNGEINFETKASLAVDLSLEKIGEKEEGSDGVGAWGGVTGVDDSPSSASTIIDNPFGQLVVKQGSDDAAAVARPSTGSSAAASSTHPADAAFPRTPTTPLDPKGDVLSLPLSLPLSLDLIPSPTTPGDILTN